VHELRGVRNEAHLVVLNIAVADIRVRDSYVVNDRLSRSVPKLMSEEVVLTRSDIHSGTSLALASKHIINYEVLLSLSDYFDFA